MVLLAHVPMKKELHLLSEKLLFHRYMGQRHHEPVLFEVRQKRLPLNMCPVLWPEIRHRSIHFDLIKVFMLLSCGDLILFERNKRV